MRTFFAVICFGIGVASAVVAAKVFMDPQDAPTAWIPAMFAGMLLLGTFLLLRRRP